MVYASVCAGIEAASVAWKPLGWKPAWFCEIDPHACSVLEHRFPNVENLGDITEIDGRQYRGSIDVLVGGTPCQSFSVAGLRKGLDDDRGNLAFEFLRIVGEIRPRWVVWENVPGVLSMLSHDAPDPHPPDIDLDGEDGPEDGREVVVIDEYEAEENHAFVRFLACLSELGYGWAARTLDSRWMRVQSHPFAVPQRRNRVFVVGCLTTSREEPDGHETGDHGERSDQPAAGDARGRGRSAGEGAAGRHDRRLPQDAWKAAAGVLLERESLQGHPPPRREAGQVASALTANGVGGGGGAEDDNAAQSRHLVAPALTHNPYGDHESREGLLVPEVSSAVTAKWQKGTGGPSGDECQNLVAHALTGEGHDASEDGAGRGTPIVAMQGNASEPIIAENGEAPTLDTKAAQVAIAISAKDSTPRASEGVAPTLRAMGHDKSHANAGGHIAVAFQTKASAHQSMNPSEVLPALDVAKAGGVAVSLRGRDGGNTPEVEADEVSPALRASQGGSDKQHVLTTTVRRITPLEAERLMGLPDGFTAVEHRGKPMADGPRYRLLGNSIAVNVLSWLGQRIQMVEEILRHHDQR